MARSFGNMPYSRRSAGGAGWPQGPAVTAGIRIFLVSIQRPELAPFSTETRAFEPMRVMRVQPGDPIEMSFSDAVMGPLPMLKASAAASEANDEKPLLPRAVRGEILRDEYGRLYEKIGQRVRHLHQVVSGPRGEIVDLIPTVQPQSARRDVCESIVSKLADEYHRPPATTPERQESPAQPGRKLFPDPGQWCVVGFGDFRGILAPQLARPERLRDTHRLACFVQVYESATVQSFDKFADWVKAQLPESERDAAELRPLTEAAARVLGLSRLLLNRRSTAQKREPGVVIPGDRLFSLQVARDPTADPEPRSSSTHAGEAVSLAEASRDEPSLKTAISEEFTQPWAFQLTREEALCDIRLESSFASPMRSLLRSVVSLLAGRARMKRWRALLSGKSADEQLWSIRPPRGSLTNPKLRDWARATLAAAGYDVAPMLTEWEIYWRRKGLN